MTPFQCRTVNCTEVTQGPVRARDVDNHHSATPNTHLRLNILCGYKTDT